MWLRLGGHTARRTVEPTFNIAALIKKIEQASSLLGQDLYLQARELLLAVVEEARAHKIESGFLYFSMGVVADYLNEPVTALDALARAVHLDSLAPAYRRSWNIVERDVIHVPSTMEC